MKPTPSFNTCHAFEQAVNANLHRLGTDRFLEIGGRYGYIGFDMYKLDTPKWCLETTIYAGVSYKEAMNILNAMLFTLERLTNLIGDTQ